MKKRGRRPSNNRSEKEITLLAKERTMLANERTMLAHFRTALASLIFGFAILQFGSGNNLARTIGSLAILSAIFLFAIGPIRYHQSKKRIHPKPKQT